MAGRLRRRLPAAVIATGLLLVACTATLPGGSDPAPLPGPEPVAEGTTSASPTQAPPSTSWSPPPKASPAPLPGPTADPPPAGPAPQAPDPPAAEATPPTTRAVDGVPAAWAGRDVEVLPTQERVVALTFDGGSSDTAVEQILATLAGRDVTATFFVTGRFARSYPEAVRAMADGGFPVGNHSDTHPSFAESTNEVIRRELAAAEESITELTGTPARPLFRFPFGARTPLDVEVVNAAGYVPFRWTVDSLGWAGTARGITADVVCERVLDAATPGAIVLMHVGANPDDGSTFDADALPCIIDGMRERGYAFTDLRTALR